MSGELKITIRDNGPYLIEDDYLLVDASGRRSGQSGRTALCRCGHSENKPFCDGTHRSRGFESCVRMQQPADEVLGTGDPHAH
jgi:CDGSH-type Zn-finger protein